MCKQSGISFFSGVLYNEVGVDKRWGECCGLRYKSLGWKGELAGSLKYFFLPA